VGDPDQPQALGFEAAWRRGDPGAVLAWFADDAELVSKPPVLGRAEAELRDGRVAALHLGG
jgi:ketosteroid isomerase-like protein